MLNRCVVRPVLVGGDDGGGPPGVGAPYQSGEPSVNLAGAVLVDDGAGPGHRAVGAGQQEPSVLPEPVISMDCPEAMALSGPRSDAGPAEVDPVAANGATRGGADLGQRLRGEQGRRRRSSRQRCRCHW